MASSIESSPPPLKSKLSQVKYLLDDANKRLHEEMSKNYEIFTTKTSASGSANLQHHHQQQANMRDPHNLHQHHHQLQDASIDLKRTISDISTLKSVLSCPIFDRIVNVTDSLDKLSYQLNLHPSIGPSDINIDSNGELILAPPMEPASLNNLINSKLDEYSDHSNLSPHILSPNLIHNSNNNQVLLTNNDHQQHLMQGQTIGSGYLPSEMNPSNGYSMVQQQNQLNSNNNLFNQLYSHSEHFQATVPNSYVPNSNEISSLNVYDTEKLVSNGANKTYATSNKARRQQQENNIDSGNEEGRRLYKSNGHFKLDQVQHDSVDMNKYDYHSTQSMTQVGQSSEQANDLIKNGFTNEMYKTTHELNHADDSMAIDHQQHAQSNGPSHPDSYMQNNQSHNISVSTNGKIRSSQNSSGVPYNRSSCSPSTSAGSTVRLADECDSGASSYQSQTAKAPYQSYPYKANEHVIDNQTVINARNDDAGESMEHELIDNISPEMERIKVTLEKDSTGLGITIAGYTCEKEEISGIFIKSITPNSPADRSGKIRTLDQIFAVNGRELLGYNNKDAVNELRHTDKVVTLELMRYLTESKYQKLQTALAHAKPTLNTNSRLTNSENLPNQDRHKNGTRTSSNPSVSPTKSSIPISKVRENNQSPTKSTPTSPTGNPQQTLVQVSSYQQQLAGNQLEESLYKNEAVSQQSYTSSPLKGSKVRNVINQLNNSQIAANSQSQIPIAAQRGGTNKVIETKQGARNTIDIRSPVCQSNNATYVNKVSEFEFKSKEPEWEKEAEIIEIYKDSSQGLGFIVKDYNNPKDPNESIIMITSLTPGGIAEKDGRLSSGDLLIFVDDISLKGASLDQAVKALKKTNGQVRLGVLKLKRTPN